MKILGLDVPWISQRCFQLVNFEKQLKRKRDELRKYIEENAIDYGIGYCEPEEIDRINILNASIKSMHRALNNLSTKDGEELKPISELIRQINKRFIETPIFEFDELI
mgnify:CR=1 FL=1